jgi:CRP/FNR family transcriptional regulator, dissimilatory nitrate respiration regulator
MDLLRRSYVSALACSKTFADLPDESLRRLAVGASDTAFRRGSIVFGRGAPATGIHVVMCGQLKLSVEAAHGDEHVIEIAQTGDSFGEAATLTDRVRLFTATALSDCRLLHVARGTLLNELARDPHLMRCVMHNVSEQLYRLTGELENVLFRKAEARVARFILEQLVNQDARSSRHLHLTTHKGIIASRLNMTKEHFSRVLRELRTNGQIEVSGRYIRVIDEPALRQLAA